MNQTGLRPVICRLILVYDRTATDRFPFQRKWYRFSYDRATNAEAQEVLRLFEGKGNDDLPSPPTKLGEARLSLQLGGGHSMDRRILQYRHLFDYVPDEKQLCADMQNSCAGANFSLGPESYFEDENERPITLVEVFDEEAKRDHGNGAISILFDHPESILRCGPAHPVRPGLWCQADAELMAQIWDIYAHLIRSRWLRSPCVVSPLTKDKYYAVLPVHEDCMAVILPFRQLYSKDSADDLFNRCCRIHNRHCTRGHPTLNWIKYYQTRFNDFLERPVSFPLKQTTLPARRYLDAFAYGAKVVHATSKKGDPAADLNGLLEAHAREVVVMGYHYVLRMLLGYVSMSMPVLQQNVTHWIKDLGWAGTASPGGRELFGG